MRSQTSSGPPGNTQRLMTRSLVNPSPKQLKKFQDEGTTPPDLSRIMDPSATVTLSKSSKPASKTDKPDSGKADKPDSGKATKPKSGKAAKPGVTTEEALAKSWDDPELSLDEFIKQYEHYNPSVKHKREWYEERFFGRGSFEGKPQRVNPETGSLKTKPKPKQPKFPANIKDPKRVDHVVSRKLPADLTGKGFDDLVKELKELGYTLRVQNDAEGLPTIKRRPGWGAKGAEPLHIDVGTMTIKRGLRKGGSNRISIPNKVRKLLVDTWKTDNPGTKLEHQAHHLVPDEIARKAKLFKEAINRGLFEIDHVKNAAMLPDKKGAAANVTHPVHGPMKNLPVHRTSHGKFNKKALGFADTRWKALQKLHGKKPGDVPASELKKAIEGIQEDLIDFLQTKDARIPATEKRAGELAKAKGAKKGMNGTA